MHPAEAGVAIADGIYRLQVASAAACAEIVAAAERTDAWRPAEINANLDVDRTIRDAEVVHEHAQPALFAAARNLLFDATRDLAARLAPGSVLAELQLVRYRAGGRYADHRDTPALGATPRALSIVWYLNDGFGGGATAFTDAAIAVEPRAGTAVAFLPDRLHRAEPVTAGTKIVLTGVVPHSAVAQRAIGPTGIVVSLVNMRRMETAIAPPAVAALPEAEWGSDVVAAVLRALDIPFAALVPGASFRGLHDSMVNYLEDTQPKMLLCLHEEHAVAIAHGYAKVTGVPMLAIVHSNVGLMHASMAVFNAWCDRAPILMLGANGPVDAARRRPWIDWIHTSQDMGALVRPYTKWDDQPGSPRAAVESILRAYQIAATAPYGPTYVCLDTELQEEHLAKPVAIPDVAKFAPPHRPEPARADLEAILALLRGAHAPVFIAGRCSRTLAAWNERIALAEAFNARVITQYKIGAMFPTEHPLHAGQSGGARATEALRAADVIVDLDALDIAGVLKAAARSGPLGATLVSCSVDRYVHNGWSMDYQGLPALDLNIATSPDELVSALLAAIGSPAPRTAVQPKAVALPASIANDTGEIGIDAFAQLVGAALDDEETCYTRLPLGVDEAHFIFRHPLDYLGGDGGGGVGGGTGMGVGAALALRGTSRLPVCVTGDGDYLMGVTALWTAVHSDIPVLVIVANNRSYFNDEVHQERMAKVRNRPVERKWIGQRLDDPAPDLAGFARAQGAIGIGPIERPCDVTAAIAEGVRLVRAGKVCVIDVIVRPEYAPSAAAGVTNAMHAPTRGGGAERGD